MFNLLKKLTSLRDSPETGSNQNPSSSLETTLASLWTNGLTKNKAFNWFETKAKNRINFAKSKKKLLLPHKQIKASQPPN